MIKNYFIPNTIEEALSTKERYGEKGKFIAGGTELNLTFNKKKYDAYIDIRNLNFNKIEKKANGDIEIGATITFQELLVNEYIPQQLKKAASFMESRNIRNIATIGGNIGGGKSVADLIPTLLVLDAQLKIAGKNTYVPIEEYIADSNRELIETIIIKSTDMDKIHNARIHSRTSNDLSLIGVAISYNLDGEKVKDVKIAIGGTAPTVERLRQVEEKIEGTILNKFQLAELVRQNVSPITDIRGSKEFKTYLAVEIVAECFGIKEF